MRKMRRRILSGGLIVLMVLCMLTVGTWAAAPESDISPQYVGIMQINATLAIGNTGKATCSSAVTLKTRTYSTDATMILYSSSDGANWAPLKSWSASAKGDVSLKENYYVLSGYYYKVTVTAEIYDASSNLVETASSESNIVRY